MLSGETARGWYGLHCSQRTENLKKGDLVKDSIAPTSFNSAKSTTYNSRRKLEAALLAIGLIALGGGCSKTSKGSAASMDGNSSIGSTWQTGQGGPTGQGNFVGQPDQETGSSSSLSPVGSGSGTPSTSPIPASPPPSPTPAPSPASPPAPTAPRPMISAATIKLPWVLQAADPALLHASGQANGSAWVAAAGTTAATAMIYGPYLHDLPSGIYTVRFAMSIQGNGDPNDLIATIDVNDAVHGQVLAARNLYRRNFLDNNGSFNYDISFESPSGGALEFRTLFQGAPHSRSARLRCMISISKMHLPSMFIWEPIRG